MFIAISLYYISTLIKVGVIFIFIYCKFRNNYGREKKHMMFDRQPVKWPIGYMTCQIFRSNSLSNFVIGQISGPMRVGYLTGHDRSNVRPHGAPR